MYKFHMSASQMMKNGQDVIIQRASGTWCSGYNKHALPHA